LAPPNTDQSVPTTANRVGDARRESGLTQKELAHKLGVPLWKVDRLERGEVDPDPYLDSIAKETNRSGSWLRAPEPTPAPKPSGNGHSEASHPIPTSPVADSGTPGWAVWLVLGSIAALVLVRFFTETLPLVPRAANVIDIPIFFALTLAVVVLPRTDNQASRVPRWLVVLGSAFLILTVIATVANPSRVAIGPVVVFIYTTLSPLVVFGAVRRIWPAGNAGIALRVLIGLGLIQLAVGLFYNLPAVLGSQNPDQLSGTFGTNPYQFVFFMLVFVSALAGVYVHMKGTMIARFAPVLIGVSLLLMVLAQYRSLLPTTALTLLFLAILLGRRSGRGLAVGLVSVVVLAGILAFASKDLPFLKISGTLDQDPVTLASKRLQITDQLTRLYTDTPRFALTGTGPGTYSSRAWQTFANSGSESQSNVVGSYAQALTGGIGHAYQTDVSRKYVLPLLRVNPVQGSYAVTSPYSSYISIAAEVGIIGMLCFAGMYFGAMLMALSRASVAVDRGEWGPLPPLLVAAGMGFFVLIQMGVLQSWMEATRLTFIAWLLLAIATKEFDARSMRLPALTAADRPPEAAPASS
jgi:hypothetical protein